MSTRLPATDAEILISKEDAAGTVPSWVVGICGVAAVASALFSILLFLNR